MAQIQQTFMCLPGVKHSDSQLGKTTGKYLQGRRNAISIMQVPTPVAHLMKTRTLPRSADVCANLQKHAVLQQRVHKMLSHHRI